MNARRRPSRLAIIVGQFGAQQVSYIGRDAFIKNKRAAGRPHDLADIDALL